MNTSNIIPAMMYGTQLASEGLVPCSVSGVDYKQFYEIWKCPRIEVEVAVSIVVCCVSSACPFTMSLQQTVWT